MKNKIGFLLLSALIICSIAYRLVALNHSAQSPKVEFSSEPKEDEIFFNALVSNGLIRPVSEDGETTWMSQRLVLSPFDSVYSIKIQLEKVKDPGLKAFLQRKRKLINRLYHKEVGRAVQKAVALWNQAHYFAAVRDDRPLSDNNLWEISDAKHINLRLNETGKVPEYGVFVTNGILRPGFGDWVKTFNDHGGIEFRSQVKLDQGATITVQAIGKVMSVHPHPSALNLREIQGRTFKKLFASIKHPGSSIKFSLPSGEHDLRIVMTPVEFRQDHIPGLNIRWEKDKTGPDALKWVDTTLSSWKKPSTVPIYTADGVLLLSKAGVLTQKGWDLGLAALTGTSIRDRDSLAWIFSSDETLKNISLTIDASLQELAQNHLEEQIQRRWGEDQYAQKRKGAVTILDADTGEILAAASYPPLKEHNHPYDLRAFKVYYPNRGPLIFNPWKGLDGGNTPGSTFKPVVAMAAGTAETSSPDVLKFLKGYPRREFHKSGLTLDCAAYDPSTDRCFSDRNIPDKAIVVRNYKRHALGRNFTNEKKETPIGLTLAIRDSINVYFARLAQLLEWDKAVSYDRAMIALKVGQEKPEFPDFILGRFAKQLGFSSPPLDLLSNLENILRLNRTVPGKNMEGDTAFGAIGELNLLDENQRWLQQVLARSSFGQAMTASPLEMARIAAFIATGRLPFPFLVGRVDDDNLKKPEKAKIPVDKTVLALLKAGMKAVTVSGTAGKAFFKHPLQDSIYGKTGTAKVKTPNYSYFSTWFIGWQDPIKEGGRRLAFACFVTHAGDNDTGGKVAAPIVARILKDLHSKNKREAETAHEN